MKTIKLFGTFILGVSVFAVGATTVNAAPVAGQEGSTPTQVEILDDTSEDAVLLLDSVPTAYNFETVIQDRTYTITDTNLVSATTDNNVVVINGNTSQNWSVKASLKHNTLNNGTTDFTVSNFTINGANIASTGSNGVVAQATTGAGNSGSISTPVTGLGMTFSDTSNVLVVGDVLTGTINYSLFNTADAS